MAAVPVSSSVMVMVAAVGEPTSSPLEGSLNVKVNVSSPSSWASLVMKTVIVLLSSPGANDSVPEAAQRVRCRHWLW